MRAANTNTLVKQTHDHVPDLCTPSWNYRNTRPCTRIMTTTSAKSVNTGFECKYRGPGSISDHSPSEPVLSIDTTLNLCSVSQRTFRCVIPLGYNQFKVVVIEPTTDMSELDVRWRHLLNLHWANYAFGDGFKSCFRMKRFISGCVRFMVSSG